VSAAHDYDAIVIGAGHNGLAATALLAKRGLRVLCLEKIGYLGGMAGTREILTGCRNGVLKCLVPMNLRGLADGGAAHRGPFPHRLGPCASERDRVVPEACEVGAGSALSGCPAHARSERAEPAADSLHSGVVPVKESAAAPGEPSPRDTGERPPALTAPHPAASPPRPRRLAWADLLRRVFAIDVLRCPDCGGRMRILAAIHPPEATQAILACLGLPARAPPTLPAHPKDSVEATAEAWGYEPGPDT
jgi:hypothetical protein